MAPPQESQLRLERDQKYRSSPGPASTAVTSTAGTRHGGPCPSWGSFLPAPPDSRETPTSLVVPKSSAPFRQTLIHHRAPCGFPRPGDNTQSHVSCAWGRHAANLGRGFTNWTMAPVTSSRASGGVRQCSRQNSRQHSRSPRRLETGPCPTAGTGARTRLPGCF